MAQEQDLGDLKEVDVGDLIKSDHGAKSRLNFPAQRIVNKICLPF
jgi:hypothetical protein